MKIGDVAERTGLTVHTLRYYERIGLIPFAARDEAGQRVYDSAIFPWLDFLGRLKQTGMPIQQMLRYAQLRAAGPDTGPERGMLLAAHRETVRARIAELHECLLALDAKIESYANASRGIGNDTHTGSTRRRSGKPARTGQADPVGD
ncbi:MerR family transcriptional regulator [Paraburkholderia caballeronis]|uniref:DNA-binding transcriptional regulator, MerR family n=1 Tax=Paraburkholderia caballeronis TaxID=416943 RepID=A0A1H7W9V1_9BURK|nr:MerR family transcriptional regulator [Paraburkholderia caballeronis]PXW13768.1 MerR family transcriptional regulator [Paraburkholderia caballeronis]PXW92747.1 MerR family transcriptional regulator [Paraburkholderia caballeronis]RAJ86605.1 MerR family transcriptional regulator [Paraburkholderia caballeronis]SEE64393.1 transcriptional regulator, MerR family [Paraburkholderia caballeronis]SEM17768.1 DNA-binding transcriptional regulator, MerR family [Paraburkholderia caballeronis]